MTSVVLIDAGRSAVIPDDPDLPETPTGLTEDVIEALLRRTCLDRSELTELFLADPRCLSTGCSTGPAGWEFDPPPLGLRITAGASASSSVAQAVRAIEQNPDVVAVVAAADFGPSTTRDEDTRAYLHLKQHMAHVVAAGWDVAPEEMACWARSSYTRSAECSAAGDFAAEIVSTMPGYLADCFVKPQASDTFSGGTGDSPVSGRSFADEVPTSMAHPARGASAILLASESNAIDLGLRFRARLHATPAIRSCGEFGIAPFSAHAIDELLAPGGFYLGGLDQLEVPEQYAVTPVAWMKETGMSEFLVNPRGGELAFGHLPRSGQLRSLVTMVNSLEDTGGRAGALVASDTHRTTVFVLTVAD